MKGPLLKLNNGIEMPALGLGVYQSSPEDTVSAVKAALADGYRMVDTAAAYLNEEAVGQGLRECDVAREEVFVQTKLWMSDYGYDRTMHAFDRSMRKLGLDYLDLYLLHWPVPRQFDKTVDTWKAVEKILADGRVRAIGICNARAADLRNLIERTNVVPAVNQVELHPYFAQPELQKADRELGIITQAWSPIGGVARYWGDGSKDPLTDETIAGIAAKYGKTNAQIILRWHIELGHSVIPKSVHADRIRENGDIFDFSLTPEEVGTISGLNVDARSGPDPEEVTPELFNFAIED